MLRQKRDRFPLSILYAGDESGERRHFVESLERHFYTFYHTEQGPKAWRLYDEHRPDMVLTDIQLPGMGCLELVEKIRRGDQQTPVVAMGNASDPELLLKAVRLHLYDFIPEPCSCTRLLDVVSGCARHLRREPEKISLGQGCYYSYRSKQIMRGGTQVSLTHKEIVLLELLLEREGYLVYYATIEERVWSAEVMSMDALKSLVKKLRHKLPECTIRNVAGTGYQLERPA